MSFNNKEICDFSLKAYLDSEFITVNKEDLVGKWSVLFFYPADFTFVCPTELEDLATRYDKFKALGCEIYSVSNDTHFVHKAWHDSSDAIGKVEFPMIGDPTARLSKYLDVYIPEDGTAERATFIINPEGKIVMYEISAGPIGRNADELLRKVEASQFVYEHGDQACPANWHPGEKTLTPGIDLVGKI